MNRSERLIHSAFDASRAGAFKWHIADGLVELSYGLLALLGLSDRGFDGRFDTVATNELLKSLVNNGSSIIAFMGHSGSVRLDFNLENIESYKNKDRYHMFMAVGCYAGQMFWENRSISEEHNLANEKGSIVYLANTTAGYPDVLGFAGSEFYRQLGGKFYGKSVGEANAEALKELLIKARANNDDRSLSQALSTIYNGDPAVILNVKLEQDFTLDGKTAVAEPNLLFSSSTSFSFKLIWSIWENI